MQEKMEREEKNRRQKEKRKILPANVVLVPDFMVLLVVVEHLHNVEY